MKLTMNVLIITRNFYPYNNIGSFRINSFAKYFRKAGNSVTVVAEGERDEAITWNGCDIHYIKDPIMTPKYLHNLEQKNNFDVVLSSYGPLTPHALVMKVLKKRYKFFWVADMRDEMSKLPYYSKIHTKRLAFYERNILEKADLVLSVSKPLIDDFKTMCSHDRFLEVRNGYDYEECYEVNFQPQFTMGYIGRFYWMATPDNFLRPFRN